MKQVPIIDYHRPESFIKAFGGEYKPIKSIKKGANESNLYQLPKHVADGHIEVINIGTNLTVIILDFFTVEEIELKVRNDSHCLLSFSLENKDINNFKHELDFNDSSPSWRFINPQGEFLNQKFPKSTHGVWVSLAVTKSHLNDHFQLNHLASFKSIRYLFNHCEKQIFKQLPLDHQLSSITNSLLNINIHDDLRLSYINSKASEILCISLDKMLNFSALDNILPIKLKGSDESAIKLIHEIIMRDLSNIPSLKQICLDVGLNRNKLHYGFKKLFKMSLTKLIKEERLSKARELLIKTNKPVIDIAIEVGFNHHSSFSTAFRDKYGLSPIDVRKE